MTPYREAGEVPKEESNGPARPDVQLTVGRYPRFALVLIVIGGALLTAFLAWVSYAGVRVSCDRSEAGARPRCTGTQLGPYSKIVGPFDLYDGSLAAEERGSFDDAHTVLKTPGGDLEATVDDAFARETVAGADRYLATPSQIHFEAKRTRSSEAIGMGIGGLFFTLFLLFALRRTRLVVDRNAGVVRTQIGRTISFDGIAVATKEEIDDSAFFSLVLVSRDDSESKTIIAQGRAVEVDAAAAAINAALAERHASTNTMPEALKKAGAARTKIDTEAFLRDLPLASLEIERDKKGRRVAAVGTSNGLRVRVGYGAKQPGGTLIEVTSVGKHGNFDVRLDEKPPAVFEGMPQDFGRRVEAGMRQLGIRYLQIRKDGVTGRCIDAPGDIPEARAQVSAAIALIVEVAEHFSR